MRVIRVVLVCLCWPSLAVAGTYWVSPTGAALENVEIIRKPRHAEAAVEVALDADIDAADADIDADVDADAEEA